MNRHLFVFLALLCAVASPQSAPPPRPKLVLLIAIDQFRYDYLPRFRNQYTGGINLLLNRGATFVDAHLEHYPAVTAVGHSTMLSGATPAISGIIGNDWYNRISGKQVTSVSDENTSLLGRNGGSGASPRRLLVSTIGDELKRSGSPGSKVIGISFKDRSAILPVGHMADAAYWFDTVSGAFISSSFYFPHLPDWVRDFNAKQHGDEFAGRTWLHGIGGQAERRLPLHPGRQLHEGVYNSPFGNDLLELFAERAIESERLGRRGSTDLLAISFSSNDAVGHTFGPDSPEVREISISVDRTLARFFSFVERTVGLDNALVVLTSDHGVSPVPEVLMEQKMPGGRIAGDFFAPLRTSLETRFGPGKWLVGAAGTSPYLNEALIEERKLDEVEVERVAARAMAAAPHVSRVYTREQLLTMRAAADRVDARVLRSFHPRRSGDLEIVLDPYWIRGSSGTTHGTPYNYDSHIPLIFMGNSIRPGRYYRSVALNDVAPTLAAILDIETPSGSVGRVLEELIQNPVVLEIPATPTLSGGR